MKPGKNLQELVEVMATDPPEKLNVKSAEMLLTLVNFTMRMGRGSQVGNFDT